MQLHWVPRSENEQANFPSLIIDTDDWQISYAFFQYVNSLWKPAAIDDFARFKNTKLPMFNSRFWNPGTETADCFTADWRHDMNLLVPPLNLVARCLGYLTECKAKGLLICPAWKSASFWPLLFPKEENPVSVVTDYKIIPNDGNVFIAGSCKKKKKKKKTILESERAVCSCCKD